MTTPGKPLRQSGIPTPGRTGIPAPGRARSVSNIPHNPSQSNDVDYLSRTLADAIKANDPAQHRKLQQEPRPVSPHLSSGRRSVAESYGTSRPLDRAKTPITQRPVSRPPSRHSDIFSKSVSRRFEIGDSVKIDSLGLEGVLRYTGEIEGKAGLWAGVELIGQFSGKGKNNGSVNGIQYFSCMSNCGVFVAMTKLLPGRVHLPRPPSPASSGTGRTTPSLSGRNTPSVSTIRLPSASMPKDRGSSTLTSSQITPSAPFSSKSNYLSKSTSGYKDENRKLPEKLTPGSRAAKYANMTAKQLNSRSASLQSPSRQSVDLPPRILPSPSPISRTVSSPSRAPGSPFSTPKPGMNGRISNAGSSLSSSRTRPLTSTPRARIPSAAAMPPPASPTISRSASLSHTNLEDLSLTNLELQGKTIQDRISLLIADLGTDSTHNPTENTESLETTHSVMDVDQLADLQASLDALRNENEQLRCEREESQDQTVLMHSLRDECAKLAEDMSRVAKEKEELLKMQQDRVSSYEKLNDLHRAGQARVNELELQLSEQLDEARKSIQALKDEVSEVLSTRIVLEDENSHLKETRTDLLNQVDELGTQVYELRLAGQETIALYEERLSVADSQRYELELRLMNLEKGVNTSLTEAADPPSNHISATEIDNETLRDQVLHLQKKIAVMEDLIEDSRMASERDEAALKERMKRVKEKEDSMKIELAEGQREVDRMAKAEATARSRVEEIEEALRESQVALENARAEIETLRTDLANNSSRVGEAGSDHQRDHLKSENLRLQSQNNELLSQAAQMKEQMTELTQKLDRDTSPTNGEDTKSFIPKHDSSIPREEITGLKHIVQELQKEHSSATHKIKLLESENQMLVSETHMLRSQADHLSQEIQILESKCKNNHTNEPLVEGLTTITSTDVEALRQLMKEQKTRYETDAEQLRKRFHELEMKHARTTHDLHKEISELEALVESKIYREDELEQEVERLKERISKLRKSQKGSTETRDLHPRASSTSSSSMDINKEESRGECICEICERPGHDIFNCELLKEDVATSLNSHASDDKFCSDCETWGHISSDCPHSQEVF